MDPFGHIAEIRLAKFGIEADGTKLPNPLELDLRHALRHLAEELYSKKHHFILELIQNAEDNTYRDGDKAMLSLQLLADDPTGTPDTDGCLLLLNNEKGFQPEHIQSLCSVGQSTKTKREGYIGEKGIGFKSVFQVSHRPHIFSNGYQLHFRHPETDDDLGYIVPHWVVDIPEVLRESKPRTAILLPLIRGQRDSLATELLSIAPETILFLAKLSELHIDTGTAKRTVIRDARDGFVTLHSSAAETRYFVFRADCPCPGDLPEEKRVGVEHRELTIAFPLDAADDCSGRIFAFLPTECDSGFPFLVNADFLLTANREAILEGRDWNRWLRNCIGPAFVLAFKNLLQHEAHRCSACRFIPLQSDLRQQMPDFFRPVVDAIHKALQGEECVWSESGGFVQPGRAWFVGKTERTLLQSQGAPPRLAAYRFVAPELERWRHRLLPLGVRLFTSTNFLEVINDQNWLQERDEDWWESALQFLAEGKVNAGAVAQLPLLRCADGICRKPEPSEVFLNGESPIQLPGEGPDVHLFDASLQRRLQQKPLVWAWLTQTLRLIALSPRAYIVNRLLPWMRAQSGNGAGARVVAATRFIFANSASLDDAARASLKAGIPWLLDDGRITTPEARTKKELVTPEALEGANGWHWLFIGPADREHFYVLSGDYVYGATDLEKVAWRKFLGECGVTGIPDPARREMTPGQPLYANALDRCASEVGGTPLLQDWVAPRWLRDLAGIESLPNSAQKVGALERWLGAFSQSAVVKFLRLSKGGTWGDWEELHSWSELGFMLWTKPWLETTLGYRKPSEVFIQTQELRDFLGDSVPYVQTTVSVELLEKLGARVRLTADVLLDLLRQMRDSGEANFDLITRIYRRLHDSQFDISAFRTEALVYLGEGTRWRKLGELVWKDTGPVFDEHFGYLEPVYGAHDLHGFFTQKLQVPEEPALRQFAEVWAKLSQENSVGRESVERRLKQVIDKLVTAQESLTNESWWPEVRRRLKVWVSDGSFLGADRVYAPDDGFAVEVFSGHVPIAWNPVQAHRFAPFLKALGCRSLAGAMHATLRNEPSESARSANQVLTPASKELIVCLVCNDKSLKWRERQSFLEAVLATNEALAPKVEVDYLLTDAPDVAPVPRLTEAFWHANARRLVLKEGAELDVWRSASADSIAAALVGITQRRELADTIYRLLTASAGTARRIRQERNWSLTQEQDDWLTTTGWSPHIIDRQEREAEPVRTRSPRLPESGALSATLSPPSPSKDSPGQPDAEPKNVPSTAGQPLTPQPSESTSQQNQMAAEVLRNSAPPEQEPRQQQGVNSASSSPQAPLPGSSAPTSQTATGPNETRGIRLKHSDSEKPELRHAQPRLQTRRRNRAAAEQRQPETDSSRENRRTGLESLSQEDKAELEQLGRKKATAELVGLGYRVTPMGERSPGYDLHAEKGNEVLKVEVKAHLRTASKVFVPKGEWREYLSTKNKVDSRWELWNVEFLAEDSGHRVRITRYSEIPTDALEENGFWVDLNRCSSSPT